MKSFVWAGAALASAISALALPADAVYGNASATSTCTTAKAKETGYDLDSDFRHRKGTHDGYDSPDTCRPRKYYVEKDCIPCEGQPGNDPATFCGYDINTDYNKYTPKTCRTIEYTFHVQNTTIAPDGVPRIGLIVNGQFPGPTIEASWGDTVVVNVVNELQDNGTAIHFHGIRQFENSEYDGVPSITQCPIAPGQRMTYRWVAEQYGATWWHSHFAIQAYEGVFGGVVIHGPSSAQADIDAGFLLLEDWTHVPVSAMFDAAQSPTGGGPRTMDNGLINGMNTWLPDGSPDQVGKRFELEVSKGKSYLLRVVNVAIQSTFKFMIDGHSFTVISMDLVPIKPYTTKILNINIGQRYQIIVHADQEEKAYWMRSDNQVPCGNMTQSTDTKAIFRYKGAPHGLPTTSGYEYTPECVDEPADKLIPVLPMNPHSQDIGISKNVIIRPSPENVFRWYLDGTTFVSKWDDPTLLSLVEDGTIPEYSGPLAIEAPNPDEWVYVVVQSPAPLPHPLHLHGHDFFVLAFGKGTYSNSVPLNMKNPPRRDVALLPGAGFIVLAFKTDNPGTWLMHCHVGWHVTMGFALQIIEQKDKIVGTVEDKCVLRETCKAWKAFQDERGITTTDSGV